MHTPSQQTQGRLPLAENERRALPVTKSSEVTKDFLGWFLPDHEENTLYNMLIDGRVYATETFEK